MENIRGKKEYLDFVHSLFWFAMDAAWMLNDVILAFGLCVPTLVFGMWLSFTADDLTGRLVSISMNAWAIMNMCWLLAEEMHLKWPMVIAKSMLGFGLGSLVFAFLISKDPHKVLLHFKRLRMLVIKK